MMSVVRGHHRNSHVGRRLHFICQRCKGGGALVGVEGQKPRRGGWYLVVRVG